MYLDELYQQPPSAPESINQSTSEDAVRHDTTEGAPPDLAADDDDALNLDREGALKIWEMLASVSSVLTQLKCR